MSSATRRTLDLFQQQGFDMTRQMKIDFFVAVPDRESGEKITSKIKEDGFEVSLEPDSEGGKWTCYCSKRMVPELSAIVQAEDNLDVIAKTVGGYSDGFGSYGS